MKYQLPKLNYEFSALEPYIDARTMEIHYTKHHQAYADKLNMVLDKYPSLQNKQIIDLIANYDTLDMDEKDRQILRNSGGGYINHSFFWQIMGPKKEIDEKLAEDLKKRFNSIDEFKKIFSDTALNHFGSGWAWLVRDKNNQLEIYSLPNQDSPYSIRHTPIITLDVWEHAYYLKYQNKRVEYIQNWWSVLKLI